MTMKMSEPAQQGGTEVNKSEVNIVYKVLRPVCSALLRASDLRR